MSYRKSAIESSTAKPPVLVANANYSYKYELESNIYEVELRRGERFVLFHKTSDEWLECIRESDLQHTPPDHQHERTIYVQSCYLDEDAELPDYENASCEILSDLDERLNKESTDSYEYDADEVPDELDEDDADEEAIVEVGEVANASSSAAHFVNNDSTMDQYVNVAADALDRLHVDYENKPKPKERKMVPAKIVAEIAQTPEPDYDNENEIYENLMARNYLNESPATKPRSDSNNNKIGAGAKDVIQSGVGKTKSSSDEQERLVQSLKLPEGWLLRIDATQRWFCMHEAGKVKWYVAFDPENKVYFYNSDGESIWELPDINSSGDKKYFNDQFDDQLKTFNGIRNRTSVKNSSGEQEKTPKVLYSFKPPNVLTDKFKIVQISESGKIKSKSLESYRIELASCKLLFVKESSKTSRLEFHVDFKGGQCYRLDLKNDKKLLQRLRNPKNAFLLQALNGSKIVFMNDSAAQVDKWVCAINAIIKQMQSEFSPIYEGPESLHCVQSGKDKSFNPITAGKKDELSALHSVLLEPQLYCESNEASEDSLQELVRKHSDAESRSPYGNNLHDHPQMNIKTIDRSAVPDVKAQMQLMQVQPQSCVPSQRLKAVREMLASFFKRRPAIDTLRSRGIIQECVFGCNLSNLCNREKTTVPAFMEELIRVIERKGVDNDGLYRINGNLAEVQKLRCQIDQGKNNFNDSDIHVLAGTLKTFLRELEDPIIPKHLQEQFLDATSTQDKNRKFHKIKELVKQLPIAHYETLKVLCRHLNNVVDVSHLNRMHVQNIALVFGPTICRVNIVTSSNNIFNLNIMLPNDLVEFIFRNHEELFDSNTKVYNK